MSDFYNKYPYTDFHELNLDWVIGRVKKLTEDWASTLTEWNNTEEEWRQLYDYVHDYFDNLDVQQEINNKIDQMILDGTFATIATPIIENQVVITTTSWLADHITQPTTPVVDTTLTIDGAAAESETVGTRLLHMPVDFNRGLTALRSSDFQFIDPSEKVTDTTWGMSSGKIVSNASAGYTTYTANNVPAGTYQVGAYRPTWCYILNLKTGTITRFSNAGLTGPEHSITLNYPHSVYLTANSASTDIGWFSGASLTNYAYGVQNASYNTSANLTTQYQLADSKVVGDRIGEVTSQSVNEADYNRNSIGRRWQYCSHNESDWTAGTYNNDRTITPDAGYRCLMVPGLKAGTYYINHYAAYQTYIENIATGAMTSMHSLGYSSNTPTAFTIAYDFNIYISFSVGGNRGVVNENLLNFNPATLPIGMTDYNNVGIGYGCFDDVHILHVGADKEFTTLKAGIEAAEQYFDAILYVDAGTYDLITEFGNDYFTNFTGSGSYEDGAWGIVLKNRIHIIFAENAKVVCNYTGDNADVAYYFSAFNAGRYGFELENANIETKGIRYAVHDDRGNASEEGYKNIYRRCRIKHDKVGAQVTGMDQAIGGGLGNNGDILIEDCWFEAVGYKTPVTYHNSAHGGVGYRAHVVACGNYLIGGFRFNDTGASTDVTDVYCFDNSISYGIQHGKTTPDAENNIVLYEWNNYIRT